MTRRNLLTGLLSLVPVGLLSTNQVQKAISAKNSWKAVALIGLDENDIPTIGLYNNSENAVSFDLQSLAFGVDKGSGTRHIVAWGNHNTTVPAGCRFMAPRNSSAEIKQAV